MRYSAESFAGQELRLLYVAKRLKEALRREAILTDAGVNYVVESDRYTGGVIFRTQRIGSFFYVATESDALARETLRRSGWVPLDS